ncbi:hypothetical protein MTR_4g046020 [Medicago truncatula]|uniref:Uncharacterized protein n=1 Tax=Medicago truncatula TaxID=3880 RepID=A0A072UKI8_MEDTR|nr:hypothetical protein MTR_4g046020 [Medicago truncatula]
MANTQEDNRQQLNDTNKSSISVVLRSKRNKSKTSNNENNSYLICASRTSSKSIEHCVRKQAEEFNEANSSLK